ncbi:membrane protein YqaA with SNARE-associated domain [Rhizobium sp. PP-F2F-G48]|uniref:YqaA family protein n=1 Tax=Rhizobium sp. PP-F2F-G48 TaxID=2135651 RepID=UPI00104429F2|nr:YqaA family protein [Rhizobium sp. PP-F2F-G48]TCM54216.1 membrane protein YqaA with SNARE-associated domain [Rhizobium sp. PP-F2F-G48]
MSLAALVGVFAAAFLSATLLFGLSEAVVISALQDPDLPRGLVFVVATFGNVLGAVVNFILGRFFLRFEGRRWFPVSQKSRARAEAMFRKYGQPVLLLSWLPVIGDPLTLAAGLLRMPWPAFVLYVTIGKAVRYALLVWVFG